jgi:type II secretory ATPase GspE/PulE/Tfp pilus assembly ATPase PilB-like protein
MTAGDVLESIEKARRLGLHQIVSLAVNQRCIRRLCDHCKEPYPLTPPEIDKLFIWDQKTPVTAYREKGCPYCRQAGFFDRICVQEALPVDDNLRNLINGNAPAADILEAAARLGHKSKEYDGIKKALRGLTTFKELSGV